MARHDHPDLHGGRMRVPRSRGAASGLRLLLLGAWGFLIPLVGPYVDFGYSPDSAFHFSTGRFWLELLPCAVTFVGGVLLLVAANSLVTNIGAWLAVAGGAWFVVGPTLDRLLHLGAIGVPIHRTTLGSTLETLLLFTGIGALILFLGALAVGRLGVVSVRDVKAAQRRENDKHDDDDEDYERHANRQEHRPLELPTTAAGPLPATTAARPQPDATERQIRPVRQRPKARGRPGTYAWPRPYRSVGQCLKVSWTLSLASSVTSNFAWALQRSWTWLRSRC